MEGAQGRKEGSVAVLAEGWVKVREEEKILEILSHSGWTLSVCAGSYFASWGFVEESW